MTFFSEIKDKFRRADRFEDDYSESPKDEYVELRTDDEIESRSHTMVRPFTLEDFEDIRHVVDALRSGQVIALINIRPLKEKDINELKRAIAKLRKTCDAIEGEIAGFTEDIVIATGASAKIHKTRSTSVVKDE